MSAKYTLHNSALLLGHHLFQTFLKYRGYVLVKPSTDPKPMKHGDEYLID